MLVLEASIGFQPESEGHSDPRWSEGNSGGGGAKQDLLFKFLRNSFILHIKVPQFLTKVVCVLVRVLRRVGILKVKTSQKKYCFQD